MKMNVKTIKRIFMLPAVVLRGIVRCVTPLYNRFSWQHSSLYTTGQALQKRQTDKKSLLLLNTTMSTFRIYAVAIIFCLFTFSSCIKDVSPSDAISTETLTS